MKTIVVIGLIVICVGCRTSFQGTNQPVRTGQPFIHDEYHVPAGELLCILKYPDNAKLDTGGQFQKSLKRLGEILDTNQIEYTTRGNFSNLFYIRSDHTRTKQLITDGMAGEPFPVEFH